MKKLQGDFTLNLSPLGFAMPRQKLHPPWAGEYIKKGDQFRGLYLMLIEVLHHTLGKLA